LTKIQSLVKLVYSVHQQNPILKKGLSMKRLLIFLILLPLFLIITGCQKIVTEHSDILEEQVTVTELIYVPASHGTAVSPTGGITGSGEIGMGLTVTSVNIKEEFTILFQCQHGNFVIKRPDLWKKVYKGKTYTCLYKETYRTTYDDDQFISRELIDYDFLGLKEFPELLR